MPDKAATFEKKDENNIRLNTDKSNWLKVYISNEDSTQKEYLLFLHNVQIDRANLRVKINGKNVYTSPITGCTIPRSKRPTSDRTLSLPIVLQGHTIHEVWINVYRKEFGITVSPHLVNPANGIDFNWTDYLFFAVIFSNTLLLFICSMLYFYVKRKKISIREIPWFIVYIVISTLYIIAACGFGSMYLWTNYPWFEVNAAIFFGAISGSSFIYFCKLALNIDKDHKLLNFWFNFTALFYFVSSLPGFLMYHHFLPKGSYGLVITLSYLCLLSCIIVIVSKAIVNALQKKEAVYSWFLGIFVFYIGYTIIVMALEIGVMRYNFKVHAWRIVIFYFPQLIVTLFYLISKLLKTLDEKLDEINLLRKEVSHDIHDEIGSSLTKISLYAHSIANSPESPEPIARQVEKIGSDAVVTNSLLRDLIFAINPISDNFVSLKAYLREVTSTLAKDKDLDITYDFPTSSSNPSIDPNIKSQLVITYKMILRRLFFSPTLSSLTISFMLKDETNFELKISFIDTAVQKENHQFYNTLHKPLEKLGMNLGFSEASINDHEVILHGFFHINTAL